jgi:hypothetical protein
MNFDPDTMNTARNQTYRAPQILMPLPTVTAPNHSEQVAMGDHLDHERHTECKRPPPCPRVKNSSSLAHRLPNPLRPHFLREEPIKRGGESTTREDMGDIPFYSEQDSSKNRPASGPQTVYEIWSLPGKISDEHSGNPSHKTVFAPQTSRRPLFLRKGSNRKGEKKLFSPNPPTNPDSSARQ